MALQRAGKNSKILFFLTVEKVVSYLENSISLRYTSIPMCRMTSIAEHQRNKEKRARELQKRAAFKTPENPKRFEPSVLKPQNASFNFGQKSIRKTPTGTGKYCLCILHVCVT